MTVNHKGAFYHPGQLDRVLSRAEVADVAGPTGVVNFTLCNDNHVDFAFNWWAHIETVCPDARPVVMAVSEKTAERLQGLGIRCLFFKPAEDVLLADEELFFRRDLKWNHLMMLKVDITLTFLEMDFPVFYSDADVVFFDNPYPRFEDHANGADVAFQENHIGTLCAGVFFANPVPQTLRLFDRETTDLPQYEKEHPNYDDQNFLQHRVAAMGESLDLRFFPIEQAPNGKTWYPRRDELRPQVTLVHYNCVIGKQPKLEEMRKDDAWLCFPEVKPDPRLGSVFAKILPVLEAEGSPQDVLGIQQALVRLLPDDLMAKAVLGRALLVAGRAEESLEMLRCVAQSDTCTPVQHQIFSAALMQAGHLDEALVQASKAVEKAPENNDFKTYLAGLYTSRIKQLDDAGDPEEALDLARKLIHMGTGDKIAIAHYQTLLAHRRNDHGQTTFTYLANQSGSDKGTKNGAKHSYSRVYDMILSGLRDKPVNVLEIGLQAEGGTIMTGGGQDPVPSDVPSINMWLAYLTKANIVGFDIRDFSNFQTDRFQFVRGDAANREDLERAAGLYDKFDLVIDDGSHASHHQLLSFITLFPRLRHGGFYIIEDVHWQPEEIERSLPTTMKTADVFRAYLKDGAFPDIQPFGSDALNGLTDAINLVQIYKGHFTETSKDRLIVIHKLGD